jgi:hypothetical protein
MRETERRSEKKNGTSEKESRVEEEQKASARSATKKREE